MTDGARTRDLRSHKSNEGGPVHPSVSVQSAHLQAFREIDTSDRPLRTGAYQPGCSTVAVHAWSAIRARGELCGLGEGM